MFKVSSGDPDHLLPPTRDLQVVGPRFNPPINFTFIALDFTTTYTKVSPAQKNSETSVGSEVVRGVHSRAAELEKWSCFGQQRIERPG